MDVCVKSYSQKCFFLFFDKILDFFKYHKWPKTPLFWPQNLNSKTTFVSSTLKFEEIKVVSDLQICDFVAQKWSFGPFFNFDFFKLLYQKENLAGSHLPVKKSFYVTKLISKLYIVCGIKDWGWGWGGGILVHPMGRHSPLFLI